METNFLNARAPRRLDIPRLQKQSYHDLTDFDQRPKSDINYFPKWNVASWEADRTAWFFL